MKIFIVAALAMAAGVAMGFVGCWIHSQAHGGRRIRQRRKMGVMDRVLLLEAVVLILYTITALAVFWHTSAEPSTLTACVFGVCGIENGVMGWIKTEKERNAAKTAQGQAAPASEPEPPEDRPEPPDVGIQEGDKRL